MSQSTGVRHRRVRYEPKPIRTCKEKLPAKKYQKLAAKIKKLDVGESFLVRW